MDKASGWSRRVAAATGCALALAAPVSASAQPQPPAAAATSPGPAIVQLRIAPALTDARLAADEPVHVVAYAHGASEASNAAAVPAQTPAPLLVWLGGTGGKPETGPQGFYATALRSGWRLVALSYINTPAVSQVCVGAMLRAQRDCATLMRQQRAWGDSSAALLKDRPEDAIVPRLVRLLRYLARTDAQGQWQAYLEGEEPRWSRLLLAGQSQGGGMAGFIAQTRPVAGVVMFSGGWDRQANGEIAAWYSRPSQTPPERWHATFHVDEPQADTMARAYQRLGIPAAQVHALDLPVQGRNAHVEAIGNPAYQALWEQVLALPR